MKAVLFLCCVFLSGCASSGRRMSADDIATIKPGVSTRQELVRRFGEPSSMGLSPEGRSVCNWHYVFVGAFGAGMEQQILTVNFFTNDVVDRVIASGQFNNPSTNNLPPAKTGKRIQ